MKQKVKVVVSVVMIFVMLLALAGCGENEKKQEAIDVFNKTSQSFNEIATLINNNADKIDDELISTFQEMSALLSKYKDILESDEDLEDAKYDEMITWFGTVDDWVKDSKTQLEAGLAELDQ